MTQRLNPQAIAPKAIEPMLALEAYLAGSGLEHGLMHLVKMRASQINGCAYCLHMHTTDAIAQGETPARLFLLDAWAESTMYSPRERAALAWTDAVTKISETHAPDDVYEGLKPHFSEAEIVDLTLLIATINSWNRLAISFRNQHPNDRKLAKAA